MSKLEFALISAIVGVFAVVCSPMAVAASDADVRVSIMQNNERGWHVRYDFSKPVDAVDLGLTHNGFRNRGWRVIREPGSTTPRVRLENRNGSDVLIAVGEGEKFRTVTVLFDPEPQRL